MRQKLSLLVAFFLFSAVSAFAQQDDIPFNDLPPNPGDGRCYAKCKIADQYETVTVQKLKKAGTSKVVKAAPKYTTATERVMIKEASFKYVYRPAVYETVNKQILVKEGYCIRKKVPAKYSYKQTGKRLVSGESGHWVRKKKAPNCFSDNPDDCYIMCWEKIPAKYAYDSERILEEGEREDVQQIDAVYKTIKVQVIKEPARYDRVDIPAVYKNFTKKVLVDNNCLEDQIVTTSDQYTNKVERRLVSSGGYTGWVEILCAAKTTDNVVKAVQQRLNVEGYNVGTADGILGNKTRAMLEKYQKDNNLPVGNLNIETLKALGVEH